MSASSADKQKFREIVRSKFEETAQACVHKGHEMALGRPSLNLILAGELIRLGAAFAIRLGANEDGSRTWLAAVTTKRNRSREHYRQLYFDQFGGA